MKLYIAPVFIYLVVLSCRTTIKHDSNYISAISNYKRYIKEQQFDSLAMHFPSYLFKNLTDQDIVIQFTALGNVSLNPDSIKIRNVLIVNQPGKIITLLPEKGYNSKLKFDSICLVITDREGISKIIRYELYEPILKIKPIKQVQ